MKRSVLHDNKKLEFLHCVKRIHYPTAAGGGGKGGGDDNMSGSKTSKTSVICVELNDKGMLIIEAVALYWLLAHKIIAQ